MSHLTNESCNTNFNAGIWCRGSFLAIALTASVSVLMLDEKNDETRGSVPVIHRM
jgi:hypothetical protein